MADRPNVLVILCDQLRADVLASHGPTFVQTPNLDRLAGRGVVFENAYSQTPVCVPARQNLLTGRHSHELELMENGREKPDDYPRLAALLAAAGYDTAAIGKMHFHPARQPHGFQHMELSEEIPPDRNDDDYLQFLMAHGFGHVHEPHGQRHETYYEPQISVLPADRTTTAWTARRTASYLRQQAKTGRPFFCMAGFIKPHPPFDPPFGFERMYDPRLIPVPPRSPADLDPKDHFLLVQDRAKWRDLTADDKMKTIRSRYCGLVSHIDAEYGWIERALAETHLLDHTLIIFTSDHGELMGDHYHYGKRSFFEASARVPLIVSWPGRLPQGEKRPHLACLQDVFTTVLAACRVQPPAGGYGVDLLPAAADPAQPTRSAIVGEYGRFPADPTTSRSPASQAAADCVTLKFMWREGDWKYIYCVNGGREQLFDLSVSRDEVDDLAEARPDLCRDFRAKLVAHYRRLPKAGHFLENGDLVRRPFQRHPVLDREFDGRNFQFPIWPDREAGTRPSP